MELFPALQCCGIYWKWLSNERVCISYSGGTKWKTMQWFLFCPLHSLTSYPILLLSWLMTSGCHQGDCCHGDNRETVQERSNPACLLPRQTPLSGMSHSVRCTHTEMIVKVCSVHAATQTCTLFTRCTAWLQQAESCELTSVKRLLAGIKHKHTPQFLMSWTDTPVVTFQRRHLTLQRKLSFANGSMELQESTRF